MFWVKNPVLYFILLILKVFLNLTPDVLYKYGRLSKVCFKKDFKLVLFKGRNPVLFNSSIVLLPAEIDTFSNEKSYKKYAFITFCINRFKIVLILPAKIIAFYM